MEYLMVSKKRLTGLKQIFQIDEIKNCVEEMIPKVSQKAEGEIVNSKGDNLVEKNALARKNS